jgi:hypothetical protein
MTQERRVGLSAPQKAEIWCRWKAGHSLHKIGRAFDASREIARHGGRPQYRANEADAIGFDRRFVACFAQPCGRRAPLSAPFDIFRQQPNGNVWIEAAEDIDAATARARTLLQYFPGQYMIVDNATGDKTFVPAIQ